VGEQSVALVRSEPLKATAFADPDLFHQSAGFDLAETGQRFEDCLNLHFPNRVVGVGFLEQLLEGKRAHLQLLFDLGPFATDFGGLVERGLALLGS